MGVRYAVCARDDLCLASLESPKRPVAADAHSQRAPDIQASRVLFEVAARHDRCIARHVDTRYGPERGCNLAETRYYHNEITNAEARFSAMTAVHISGMPELYGDVVRSLLTTERNGILSKGQTTVELARASIEFDRTKDLASSLIGALSALAGKKDKV